MTKTKARYIHNPHKDRLVQIHSPATNLFNHLQEVATFNVARTHIYSATPQGISG